MRLGCEHGNIRQASEHPGRGIAWQVVETFQYGLFLLAMKMILAQIT